jgi:hypothetical protein
MQGVCLDVWHIYFCILFYSSADVVACDMLFGKQCLEAEFRKWMKFYGKICSEYKLKKGDFLSDEMKEVISSAT